MKITSLVHFSGTFDGVKIGPFVEGKDCEVELNLAQRLINSSMAVEWSEPVVEEVEGAVFSFSSESPATFDAEGFEALTYAPVNTPEEADE